MKKTKYIYILIALLPFIDLITSIESRNNISLTIGIILKGIFLLIAIYYLIFRCQNNNKKINIICLILIFLYLISYFIFKQDLLNSMYLKTEISYLFKIVYLPVIFLFFINYFKEHGFNKNYFINTMKITLIIYILLLLIPLCMKNAYNSYFYDYQGFVGWFYSANEISIIMVMLLPFMYFFLDDKHPYNFLISLPIMYVMSSIGTKGALIGSIVVTVSGLIFMFILEKGKFNKKTIGSIGILLITLFFFLGVNNLTVQNVSKKANVEQFEFIETPKNGNSDTKKEIQNENIKKLLNFLLSNRDLYYKQTVNIYDARYENSYLLLGMGFSNTDRILNPNIDKIIEIDYFDLYYHAGLAAVIMDTIPIIYTLILALISIIKKKLNFKELVMTFAISLLICLVLTAAGLSGHVLYYPCVSFYLVLICMYLLSYLHKFDLKDINYKKVQILSLHLNTGGIEKVVCNQANMLCDNYDVEIISVYNSHLDIPFKLNKKVKVIYLTNTISNRHEFLNALKHFNIFKIIKESVKAIYILIIKNRSVRKYVINSDAGVIISTRHEFTKILTKYAKDNVITISEEHNYHNNNQKEINKVVKDNKNVDYLLPTSKELTEFYDKLLDSKVRYIPNTIGNIKANNNKLNNKKIVSIGRLNKVKGYNDLITIMAKVVKKDKDITLDIYGDGKKREELENLIKEYHLEDNVHLMGFYNEEKLNEKLNDYSLFACTSLSESFGLGILESMSKGIPCIMFDDAKGPGEFVNNDNGIIITGRDLDNYAGEIIKLFNDKERLSKLGKNAYEKALEYSFDNCKDKLNELISYVIENEKTLHTNVMFISSTGGHLNELLQLKSLFNKYKYEIVTEKDDTTYNLKEKYNVSYLAYGNKHTMLKYICLIIPLNIIKSIYFYIKYHPRFIITTGAHSAVFMCILGKLFGSKIIYIETFANINSKTLSGKILYPIADKFIVQWNDMLKLYPDAVNGGWIF